MSAHSFQFADLFANHDIQARFFFDLTYGGLFRRFSGFQSPARNNIIFITVFETVNKKNLIMINNKYSSPPSHEMIIQRPRALTQPEKGIYSKQ